jgi:SAM-dependent methyltransferase
MRISSVITAYDFSGIGTLVDVGGGYGAFIAAILSANPTMRGILFDQPHVVAGAGRVLQAAGVADRCEIVGGNFLEAVPGGGDAYLLSKVILDWPDDQAVAVLRNCRRVMRPQGRLLLVEAVIPPGNTPHPGKLSDVHMLVMTTSGRERTEAEYRALLDAAGLKLTRIVSTLGETSVIEGAAI